MASRISSLVAIFPLIIFWKDERNKNTESIVWRTGFRSKSKLWGDASDPTCRRATHYNYNRFLEIYLNDGHSLLFREKFDWVLGGRKVWGNVKRTTTDARIRPRRIGTENLQMEKYRNRSLYWEGKLERNTIHVITYVRQLHRPLGPTNRLTFDFYS